MMEKGREEGRQEGRQEGREEGREEGRLSGKRETLVQLLSSKFGPLSDEFGAIVQAMNSEQLDACLDRVLTATSLEDMRLREM